MSDSKRRRSHVANTGDRPIQVGSHFHFFEVNAALRFDREAARGFRLNIPAGTAVRFEPGDTQAKSQLVALAGAREVFGLNNKVDGKAMSLKMTRRQYAEMFGPTVGDQVRLGGHGAVSSRSSAT